jgi:DNA excision repair protein ERCC-4
MNLTIITDTREQDPLSFANLPTETGTLYSGDYSVKGLEEVFAIERKTIGDIVGSLTSGRDRFMNELHRLRGFRFRRLLIVGTRNDIEAGNYRSKTKPRAVLASLAAIEARFDIPVTFSPDQTQAALTVEQWSFWSWREHYKAFAKPTPTPAWAV